MQPKVEAYLNSVEKKIGKAQSASRDEILKSAGLVEREYGTTMSDAEHTIYDSTTKTYYCEKPILLTDEEFEAVRNAYNRLNETNNSQEDNGVASLLKIIAVFTFIGGIILGLVLGRDRYGDFEFMSALIYWVASFVSGSFVLGFAEIIHLLQAIKVKK